jgi:formylglycine-generating enzyme
MKSQIVVFAVAVAMVLTAGIAHGGDHAPWPTDWNNWRDPALWAPVGNPGNAAHSINVLGQGGVAYAYNIGKYEVTAGQYTAFLNVVAKTDTYELYNANMWNDTYGCKIQQSGSSGSYTYRVASDYANRPVNFVSYWDACRFANWLHNGQPTGAEGAGTTETGAYTLTTDGVNSNTIVRNTDWMYAVTSDDEWYKAAYYKSGGTNSGYWDYPTSSDTVPGRDMADVSGNNSNYRGAPFPIDSPYYTTLAGEFQNSDSPYGTFDQGGNVFEWNEGILPSSWRRVRGGGWGNDSFSLSWRDSYLLNPATTEYGYLGFRVALVPEPGSLALLLAAAVGLLACAWRRRIQPRHS